MGGPILSRPVGWRRSAAHPLAETLTLEQTPRRKCGAGREAEPLRSAVMDARSEGSEGLCALLRGPRVEEAKRWVWVVWGARRALAAPTHCREGTEGGARHRGGRAESACRNSSSSPRAARAPTFSCMPRPLALLITWLRRRVLSHSTGVRHGGAAWAALLSQCCGIAGGVTRLHPHAASNGATRSSAVAAAWAVTAAELERDRR